MKKFYTLGIETSCDETSASIASSQGEILSTVTSSSIKLHAKYGGVVPEIATRYHVEYIYSVINKALEKSKISIKQIKFISVTQGPGLVGALMIGVQCAKAIALTLNVGIMPVNHLKAHLHAAFIDHKSLTYPFVGLLISGGHTSLVHVKDFEQYTLLGQTRDDAVGEAFDKVAKILGLGYPGGPVIEKLAKQARNSSIVFPRSFLEKDSLDFSFSGIKTAVLYKVKPPKAQFSYYEECLKDTDFVKSICAAFQDSVFDVLIKKTLAACKKTNTPRIVIGGGVCANSTFRKQLIANANKETIETFFPSIQYCGDNAAMIAQYGVDLFLHNDILDNNRFNVNPNLSF